MNDIAVKIENLSKEYRLGLVGTGTLKDDLKRLWFKIQGKEDPFLKIGESNDRSVAGMSQYVYALKEINLEIKRGERIGIIGRNGAGKSTLLKILAKVTGPTVGSVKINGRMGSLLEVGTGFHPELTGRENIFMNGTLLGMTRKEVSRKLDEIVSFSGVERYLDTPVKRYSSGMMVRLGFAVAAHLEPDILVVDEILAVGDIEFQRKAVGKMQEVSSHGRTILFVSHNMVSIKNLCSRVVVLENGKISFDGDVADGIDRYFSQNIHLSKKKLENREDRDGTQELKFCDYYITDSKDKIINTVKTGMFVKVNINYKSSKILKNCYLVIQFFDKNGQPMFVCSNNHYSGYPFKEVPKNGMLQCVFPRLTLPPGIYSFNICFKSRLDRRVIDNVENAGKLEVESGDFFGTGHFTRIKQTLVMDHKINVFKR